MQPISSAALKIPFRVHHVAFNHQSPDCQQHLQQLGFLPGEEVIVQRRAHLGLGPMVVRVGSSTFALRHDEAVYIFVA
jgi:ferrous iron transport protein A